MNDLSEEQIIEVSLEEAFKEEYDDDLPDLNPRVTCYSFLMSHRNNYKFLPNIFRDNERLPILSRHRYGDYHGSQGIIDGDYSGRYQKEPEEESREPATSLLKKGKIPVIVVDWGLRIWTPEEALEYLEHKRNEPIHEVVEEIKPHKQQEKIERSIEEIYYADQNRAIMRTPQRRGLWCETCGVPFVTKVGADWHRLHTGHEIAYEFDENDLP